MSTKLIGPWLTAVRVTDRSDSHVRLQLHRRAEPEPGTSVSGRRIAQAHIRLIGVLYLSVCTIVLIRVHKLTSVEVSVYRSMHHQDVLSYVLL